VWRGFRLKRNGVQAQSGPFFSPTLQKGHGAET
jgi:hypothetical protein